MRRHFATTRQMALDIDAPSRAGLRVCVIMAWLCDSSYRQPEGVASSTDVVFTYCRQLGPTAATTTLITLRAKLRSIIVIAPVCLCVCGSTLLQPPRSVSVASERFL